MLANVNRDSTLADVVLAVHFAFVLFVIGGFFVIWIGHARHWSFVRNFGFRITHLVAMGVVALQVIANMPCPLTILEQMLRERAGQPVYEESCIEHWIGRFLFYDLDDWVFIVTYIGFFLLIALTFWKVPPRRPHWFSPSR
jgi:hypothetical protein